MSDIEVEFVSHSADVLKELEKRIEAALEACGESAESYAIEYLNRQTKNPSGNLSTHITHKVVMDDSENAMYVGTDVEYAIYVEMGTGVANVAGGTTKPYWNYQDEEGKWHRGYPQRPKAFLKPSIANHVSTYRNIIKNQLSG